MSSLVDGFSVFLDRFVSFCQSILSVLSYIGSIFKTLWYGLTSLLTGIWDLIVQILNGQVFGYVARTFVDISVYIGTPATIFLSSLLLIVLLRIAIAFVFKLLRLNVDYHNTYNKSYTLSQHTSKK